MNSKVYALLLSATLGGVVALLLTSTPLALAQGPDFWKCDQWLEPYNETEWTRCLGEESKKFPGVLQPDTEGYLSGWDYCIDSYNEEEGRSCRKNRMWRSSEFFGRMSPNELEKWLQDDSVPAWEKSFRLSTLGIAMFPQEVLEWLQQYPTPSWGDGAYAGGLSKLPRRSRIDLDSTEWEDGCFSDAEFVADMTIPDDAMLRPGENFRKAWLIKNTGTCTWGDGFALFDFQTDSAIELSYHFSYGSGAQRYLGIDLQAPWQEGTYTYWYQMQDINGQLFGEKLYTRIVVADSQDELGESIEGPLDSAGTPTPVPLSEITPQDAEAYLERAWVQFERGDYEQALADCSRAIALDPQDAIAYSNRGWVYHRLGNYERALADVDQAIVLDPQNATFFEQRGWVYRERGDYERSLADYDKAIELDPQNATFYNSRGHVYYAQGNYERSLADYDRATVLDPEVAMFYNNRGRAHQQLGNYEQALADYDKAIGLEPEVAMAYNSRAWLYYEQGNYERALADSDQAIVLDPQNATFFEQRGWVYRERGDYERSLADYDKAIELDPQNATFYNSRGHVYYEQGNYERALTDYDKAIALDAQNATFYNNRGHVYCEQGNYERALADYDKAIGLEPEVAMAYNSRAWLFYEQGNYERALANYDQAIELDPHNVEALVGRCAVQRWLGDPQKALPDCDRAVESDPRNASGYIQRGYVYESLGDTERAIGDWEMALKLDAGSPLAPELESKVEELGGPPRLRPTTRSQVVDDAIATQAEGAQFFSAADLETAAAATPRPVVTAATGSDREVALRPEVTPTIDVQTATKVPSSVAASTDARNHIDRARDYFEQGDYEQVVSECGQAIELDPKYAAAYFCRGIAYIYSGEAQAAMRDLETAIEIDPDVESRQEIGELVRSLSQFSQVAKDNEVADWDIVRWSFVDGFRLAQTVGPYLEDRTSYTTREFISAAELAAVEHPDEWVVFYTLGDKYQEMGRYADSLQVLTHCVELSPDEIRSAYALATAYYLLTRTEMAGSEQAEDLFGALGETVSPQVAAAELKKTGLSVEDAAQQAIRWFERALALGPDDESRNAIEQHLKVLRDHVLR